jgi:hypothetical protein
MKVIYMKSAIIANRFDSEFSVGLRQAKCLFVRLAGDAASHAISYSYLNAVIGLTRVARRAGR